MKREFTKLVKNLFFTIAFLFPTGIIGEQELAEEKNFFLVVKL